MHKPNFTNSTGIPTDRLNFSFQVKESDHDSGTESDDQNSGNL